MLVGMMDMVMGMMGIMMDKGIVMGMMGMVDMMGMVMGMMVV